MDHVARFIAYASAFERAFLSDEWQEVAAFFADDAVYQVPFDPPLGGRFVGPDAIVGYLAEILERFDRRFGSREPQLLSLDEVGDSRIVIRGRVRYTHPDVPDLVFELEETAQFDGASIVCLEDRYDVQNTENILGYIGEYGPRLGIVGA